MTPEQLETLRRVRDAYQDLEVMLDEQQELGKRFDSLKTAQAAFRLIEELTVMVYRESQGFATGLPATLVEAVLNTGLDLINGYRRLP